MKARLEEYYLTKVVPELKKQMGQVPDLAVPRINKVVVSVGVGEAAKDKRALEPSRLFLAKITGQQPIVTKARHSIAGFGLRQGHPVGLKVTLRKTRMWHFLDKLINIVLPLVRDFRGLPESGFDSQANYTLGLSEQIIFPEVDYEEVDKKRGVRITIVTSTNDLTLSKRLLELLGVPFRQTKGK